MAGQQQRQEPPDPEALGDAGKRALDAERTSRREAEGKLKAAEDRLAELENAGKSDADKREKEMKALNDNVAKLTQSLADSDAKSLRAEVAMAKGLNPAQAKRLAGSTKEELEADADEILEAFPSAAATTTTAPAVKAPPSRKPAADLKGGGDPDGGGDEMTVAEIVKAVPRL